MPGLCPGTAVIALGPERLAELLLELAGSDPAIKHRIRLAVANAISAGDAAVQVRVAWIRANGCIVGGAPVFAVMGLQSRVGVAVARLARSVGAP